MDTHQVSPWILLLWTAWKCVRNLARMEFVYRFPLYLGPILFTQTVPPRCGEILCCICCAQAHPLTIVVLKVGTAAKILQLQCVEKCIYRQLPLFESWYAEEMENIGSRQIPRNVSFGWLTSSERVYKEDEA
jgi:hypothetical protein